MTKGDLWEMANHIIVEWGPRERQAGLGWYAVCLARAYLADHQADDEQPVPEVQGPMRATCASCGGSGIVRVRIRLGEPTVAAECPTCRGVPLEGVL